jgi:hypothetical protein
MVCGFQAGADYGLSACANPVRFQRVGHVRGSGLQRRKRIAELRKRQVNTSVCEWEHPSPVLVFAHQSSGGTDLKCTGRLPRKKMLWETP